ncbi:pentapeptide repeat-containing protein [Bacillus subtilis subsp. subtilis]|nr:pentapeptide repeat-containing protein [Bacillus subtilis subsp. subtilis]
MTAELPQTPLALLHAASTALTLPAKSRLVGEQIVDLQLRGAALSGPIFEACTLQRSTFERCDFSGARFFARNIVDACQFTRVDLGASGLNDTVFRQCVFERCDFRQSRFDGCVLEDCTFLDCRIIDTGFPAAATTGCRFEGVLREVRFSASAPVRLDADFSACVLDFVSFENCRLDTIIPPRDPRHVFLPDVAARARRALAALSTVPEDASTKVLTRRLRRYAQLQGDILNLDNLRHVEEPAIAAALIAALTGP